MSHPERKCSSQVHAEACLATLNCIESTVLPIGSLGAKIVQAGARKVAARGNNEHFLRMFVDAESSLR